MSTKPVSTLRHLERLLKTSLAMQTQLGALIADIKESVPMARKTDPRIEAIVGIVADASGITPAALHIRTRRHTIVVPRQIAMRLSRLLTPLSIYDIAAAFSYDHGTVICAFDSIGQRIATEPKFAEEFLTLYSLCKTEVDRISMQNSLAIRAKRKQNTETK